MDFGLSDMNSYTPDAVMSTFGTRRGGEGGGGKGRPVKIITDNSVETVVFGNNEINNDSLDAV